jgi:alkanesulfonate monooxygenase SsuD/methylene tetrahydromethanopterin reductase-like flavin-dependent oxidoreductase (luciferase family)
MRLGVKIGQWGWGFQQLRDCWQAAERAGFDVISCWDHAVAAPAGLAAWDAPSLLVAMAGSTARVRLATHVVNAALRHPFLLAAQVAVAQASSDGRVELGLGVGGATHLAGHVHRALGVPLPSFTQRLARLEACLRVFPALWRGETVDEPLLGLGQASLGPIGITPPPLVVGGTGDRTLAVAAQWADGWNVTGRSTPHDYQKIADRMRRECTRVGRTLRFSIQLFTRDVTVSPALVHDFAAAGANEILFVPDQDATPDDIRRLANSAGIH